jgi:septation ring formation regulator EzrA
MRDTQTELEIARSEIARISAESASRRDAAHAAESNLKKASDALVLAESNLKKSRADIESAVADRRAAEAKVRNMEADFRKLADEVGAKRCRELLGERA